MARSRLNAALTRPVGAGAACSSGVSAPCGRRRPSTPKTTDQNAEKARIVQRRRESGPVGGVAEEAEPGVLFGRCGFGRPRPPSRLEEVDRAMVGEPEAGLDLPQLEVEMRALIRPEWFANDPDRHRRGEVSVALALGDLAVVERTPVVEGPLRQSRVAPALELDIERPPAGVACLDVERDGLVGGAEALAGRVGELDAHDRGLGTQHRVQEVDEQIRATRAAEERLKTTSTQGSMGCVSTMSSGVMAPLMPSGWGIAFPNHSGRVATYAGAVEVARATWAATTSGLERVVEPRSEARYRGCRGALGVSQVGGVDSRRYPSGPWTQLGGVAVSESAGYAVGERRALGWRGGTSGVCAVGASVAVRGARGGARGARRR